MKILVMGDLHLRATAPVNRIDDYYQIQMNKIKWIFDLAVKEKCFVLIQPGDFFNQPDTANYVKKDIIQLINSYDIDIYSIAGQHDLRYRNFDNTSLAVLAEAKVIDMLNTDPVIYNEIIPVHIYGSSFNEEIPTVQDKNAVNILAIHRMVIQDKLLFPDQNDYVKADSFLNTYKDFDLVISGDNHNSFHHYVNGKYLINCGSIMRITTTQYEHKPCVWIYNTETQKAKQYFIPIEPVTKVFNSDAQETKDRNIELDAFITTLATDKEELGVTYEDNIKIILTDDADEEVVDLVNTFLAQYYSENKGGN